MSQVEDPHQVDAVHDRLPEQGVHALGVAVVRAPLLTCGGARQDFEARQQVHAVGKTLCPCRSAWICCTMPLQIALHSLLGYVCAALALPFASGTCT